MKFKEQRQAIEKLEQLERRADKMRGKRGKIYLEPDTVALLVVNGAEDPAMIVATEKKVGITIDTERFVELVDAIAHDEQ